MKTTLEIDDNLLRQAKQFAHQGNTTLRAVVEEALQRLLEPQASGGGQPFRLRRRTVEGRGLQSGIDESDWATIRALAYEGRGG
jgi:Arc/MetJ family transcription regulator